MRINEMIAAGKAIETSLFYDSVSGNTVNADRMSLADIVSHPSIRKWQERGYTIAMLINHLPTLLNEEKRFQGGVAEIAKLYGVTDPHRIDQLLTTLDRTGNLQGFGLDPALSEYSAKVLVPLMRQAFEEVKDLDVLAKECYSSPSLRPQLTLLGAGVAILGDRKNYELQELYGGYSDAPIMPTFDNLIELAGFGERLWGVVAGNIKKEIGKYHPQIAEAFANDTLITDPSIEPHKHVQYRTMDAAKCIIDHIHDGNDYLHGIHAVGTHLSAVQNLLYVLSLVDRNQQSSKDLLKIPIERGSVHLVALKTEPRSESDLERNYWGETRLDNFKEDPFEGYDHFRPTSAAHDKRFTPTMPESSLRGEVIALNMTSHLEERNRSSIRVPLSELEITANLLEELAESNRPIQEIYSKMINGIEHAMCLGSKDPDGLFDFYERMVRLPVTFPIRENAEIIGSYDWKTKEVSIGDRAFQRASEELGKTPRKLTRRLYRSTHGKGDTVSSEQVLRQNEKLQDVLAELFAQVYENDPLQRMRLQGIPEPEHKYPSRQDIAPDYSPLKNRVPKDSSDRIRGINPYALGIEEFGARFDFFPLAFYDCPANRIRDQPFFRDLQTRFPSEVRAADRGMKTELLSEFWRLLGNGSTYGAGLKKRLEEEGRDPHFGEILLAYAGGHLHVSRFSREEMHGLYMASLPSLHGADAQTWMLPARDKNQIKAMSGTSRMLFDRSSKLEYSIVENSGSTNPVNN